MSGITSSVRMPTIFVLLVGGAASVFLSIALSFNYLFSLFGTVSVANRIMGYTVLAGPIPLIVGAILTFSKTKQKAGVRLVLAGSVVVTVWLVLVYVKAIFGGLHLWEKLIWYVLLPAAVIATDMGAYRIHRLSSPIRADSR